MKKFRIVTVLLALCLITSSFVGGTFAKYTSTKSGSDSAVVAKWSFDVNGTEITTDTSDTVTFNVFNTINDTNNAADETDVADGKVAPGTSGSFTFEIKNTSEVTAKYSITLSDADTLPLRYSFDGVTWYDDFDSINNDENYMKDIVLQMNDNSDGGSDEKTVTILWKWVFDSTTETGHAGQTNATDTALGVTPPTVTVTATIDVEQVD